MCIRDSYTGADSIYIGVIAPYSDLGTASCLSGNALDLHGTVLDLGNFGLEQSLYQFRMGTADIDAGSLDVYKRQLCNQPSDPRRVRSGKSS